MISSVFEFLVYLPAIVVALTFHEYAHGLVAYRLGDDTPYYQGRLTINPLPHIDWVGFLMLLFFHFGWAKPVEVNPLAFRRTSPRTGMMLVSLAGPAMNMVLAALALLAIKYLSPFGDNASVYTAIQLLQPLFYINVILAAFNLIPIPPLDGSKILAGILPDSAAGVFYSLERYGTLILLLLIVTGALDRVLWPIVNVLVTGIRHLIL